MLLLTPQEKASEDATEAASFLDIIHSRAFSVACQPIVRLSDGQAMKHEVLVRFEPGSSPARLIAVAEAAGLISLLDMAVARCAISYLRAGGDLSLSVNLSAVTLTDRTAMTELAVLLARAEIDRSCLSFEITESAELTDLEGANSAIQLLRRRGHSVWLDDFGAGFASISYLQALEVDGVKIDGRYMRSALASSRDERLFRGIARFITDMGMGTVAEMIEEPAQRDLAADLGLEGGQGYLFSPKGKSV
jgi:EAL domain-containing protein (putative c-di-GMP-specific phosphodiesterase class I)